MNIQAFIFDLDGVLTDTAEFHYIAWKTTAEKLGVSFTKEDNENLKGVDRAGSLQYIIEKGQLTITKSEFEALLVEKNEHYLTLISELNPSYLFEGVLTLFSNLKEQNIKIGLASASKNAQLVVNRLGIEDLFDFIGDAAAVKLSKPAPDIFLSVAQGLSVEPKYCVGVEDAIAGVDAIKSANMFAVGVGDKNTLNKADIVYPTTASLVLHDILSAI